MISRIQYAPRKLRSLGTAALLFAFSLFITSNLGSLCHWCRNRCYRGGGCAATCGANPNPVHRSSPATTRSSSAPNSVLYSGRDRNGVAGRKQSFLVDEENEADVRLLLDNITQLRRQGLVGNNAAEKEDRPVLIYNKVGKCGSRSLAWLLIELARRNGIALVGSVNSNALYLDPLGEAAVLSFLRQLPPGSVYHRHVHFLQLQPSPPFGQRFLHFNVVRHPFERLVSSYYFSRFGDNVKAGVRGSFDAGTLNETFDECVERRRPACTDEARLWYVVPFFCGQDEACRKPSRWALARAKQHLEKNYLLVGLTEYLSETVQAMESLLPGFFAGASEVWRSNPTVLGRIVATRTKGRLAPSPATRRFVLSKMELELEFYQFAKEKFLATLRRLAVNVTTP